MKQNIITVTLVLLSLLFIHEQCRAYSIHGSSHPKIFNPQQDPIDQLVLEAIQDKMKQMNSKLSFTRVLECRVQIVAGKNYFLKVEFQDSNMQTLEYEVSLYIIPWENYTEIQTFRKIIHLSKEKENETDNKQIQMTEEDVEHALQSFVEKQIYLKFKNEGIAKFSIVSDFHIIEKQVVEGMKYTCRILLVSPFVNYKMKAGEVKSFKVTVIHQAWLDKFELIDIETYDYTQEDLQEQIAQRHIRQMDGGWNPYEIYGEDDEIYKVIQEVMQQELQKKNMDSNYEILSVQTQVVSGFNIKVHLVFANNLEYEAIIFYQSWNAVKTLTSFEQISAEIPDTTVKGHGGGWSTVDLEKENEELVKLVNDGVRQYLNEKNFNSAYKVISSQKKVVAGLLYKLYIKIDRKRVYEVEVMVQAWKGYSKVTSFNEIETQNHEL